MKHICPHCGAELPDRASFCPYCASSLQMRQSMEASAFLRRRSLLPVLVAVEPEQLRPIRYRSLGTESGTLLCFNAGQVTVDGVAYENQPVAIAPSPLSEGMGYAALWNGKERGHGTQRTETEAA